MIDTANDSLWQRGEITNRLSRLQYRRGHGVHSPFVYSIIRSVFINQSRGKSDEISLLAQHCGFQRISTNHIADGAEMIICTLDCQDEDLEKLASIAAGSGIAVVILSPYSRKELCNNILKANRSTSIDRLDYLILFNNKLPKQHFKL